jgi:mRNA-degrading endonuclease RelE of RelBE toxin-antitoxin system
VTAKEARDSYKKVQKENHHVCSHYLKMEIENELPVIDPDDVRCSHYIQNHDLLRMKHDETHQGDWKLPLAHVSSVVYLF